MDHRQQILGEKSRPRRTISTPSLLCERISRRRRDAPPDSSGSHFCPSTVAPGALTSEQRETIMQATHCRVQVKSRWCTRRPESLEALVHVDRSTHRCTVVHVSKCPHLPSFCLQVSSSVSKCPHLSPSVYMFPSVLICPQCACSRVSSPRMSLHLCPQCTCFRVSSSVSMCTH